MNIRIVPREAASSIDPAAWDALADCSITPNPFFERWCLLPALRHFDRKSQVSVVTVHDGDRLVGLFPICVGRKLLVLRHLTIWQHRDCLLTDVLYEPGLPLSTVFGHLLRQLKAAYLVSATHTFEGCTLDPSSSFCQIRRSRKAVTAGSRWEDYLARTPQKIRKEHRRIIRRVQNKEGADYVTSDRELVSTWLPRYLAVERQCWKATHGCAIPLDHARSAFFREIMRAGEPLRKVEFQSLIQGDEVLAISFRFKAQRNAYEIKTSYNENYRHLYPGVVLELLNLKHIMDTGFHLADSCAVDNSAVDRLWPDEIAIYRTTLFGHSLQSLLAKVIYKIYRRIRFWLKHASTACR